MSPRINPEEPAVADVALWPSAILQARPPRRRWLLESELASPSLARFWADSDRASAGGQVTQTSIVTDHTSPVEVRPTDPEPSPPVEFRPTEPEPSLRVATPRTVEPLAPVTQSFETLELAQIEANIRDCRACALRQGCRQTVPGVGDRRPGGCLIIGEGPGEQEDARGEPFVGRSGQLLDRMLASIGLSRQQRVYITNVVKCRPPGNRDPLPAELAACRGHLDAQLRALRPGVILLLGRHAAHSVLPGTTEISLAKLRGTEHTLDLPWGSVPVVATYHPAYLLRNPAAKSQAWLDLLRLQMRLETALAQVKF